MHHVITNLNDGDNSALHALLMYSAFAKASALADCERKSHSFSFSSCASSNASVFLNLGHETMRMSSNDLTPNRLGVLINLDSIKTTQAAVKKINEYFTLKKSRENYIVGVLCLQEKYIRVDQFSYFS